MKVVALLLLAISCGSGPFVESLEVSVVAGALPRSLPVGARTQITVKAWYPDVADFGADDAYRLLPWTLEIHSSDPSILAPSTTGGYRWQVDMPVTEQVETFDFDCVAEGETQVTIRRASGSRAPQVLPVQCTRDPHQARIEDLLRDWIDSIAADSVERRQGHIDIVSVTASTAGSGSAALSAAGGCGEPGVVCAGPPPEGPSVVATLFLDGVVPSEPDGVLTYAFVARTDNDPSSDWVPRPPFDWDLYQGTDRWLELAWDGGGWTLQATQVTSDQTTMTAASRAMAILQGSRVDFVVPLEEVGGLPLAFRMTSFAAADRSYPRDDRGGDVLGANPTEPLAVLE